MKKIKQILQNQKKYLRDLFVILGIIMLAFLAEHILLQWNSFKSEKFEQTYSLDRADEITNKWGQRTYSFNLDGRYISSAYLNFQKSLTCSFAQALASVTPYVFIIFRLN